MILVTGSFRLPPENLGAAREAMAGVIAASRGEPGCLSYAYAEDVLEPGLIRVSEAWENREALAAHFLTAHMMRWREERTGLGMIDREVTAWTAGVAEAL